MPSTASPSWPRFGEQGLQVVPLGEARVTSISALCAEPYCAPTQEPGFHEDLRGATPSPSVPVRWGGR